ncbi:MAG TPA: DUF4339 domain-containing protein, partial [Verrucomicrobiales bacterium]|nr:DUF4339 domain-containing protein [Verrucomicrobiales bacterium]
MHTPNPEKLWYYSSQGNNVGPVTYDDFKSAANSGKVDRFQDRAWCDALPDWIAVSEIEGLFSSPPPPSPGPLGVAPLSRSVRPLDGSIRPVVLPGKGPVSVTLMTVLYSVAIGLYVVGGIITALGQLEQSFELTVVGLVLLIPSVVCLIWFMVLHLKAVHRLWSYIPDGYRRTTPGKAIGFLFIPTF